MRRSRIHLRSLVRLVGILAIMALVALAAARLVSGLGLWTAASSRIRFLANLGQAVFDSGSVSGSSEDDFRNVIFLHHSTGYNLIRQGGVRERLAEAGYRFWDHDYNHL